MYYSKQVISVVLLASSAFFTSGASLRNSRRRLADNTECTVLVAEYLDIPGDSSQEPTIDCEFANGMIYSIQGTASQKKVLKQKLADGKIASGVTNLGLGVGAFVEDGDLYIPRGHDIAANFRQNPQRRKLAVVTGNKPILAVRVTDSTGKVHPDSAAVMSDNIFGTDGDPVNLKSQLSACSHGKLNVIPAPDANLPAGTKAAEGIIEVTIPIALTDGPDRYAIHNAVTAAVQDKLGYSLPGPFQQVMYMLEGCYVGRCGWAAYAYIDSWLSVYRNNYYFMPGVQVHELGHNFGLAHSGGLNGKTYTDHTGMMGNPLFYDDIGQMCFNAAKNWQIGWYNDAKRLINPLEEPHATVKLVGIADYDKRAGRPVVVKLETGAGNDYFVGFNRATRANSQNVEADNEVTIVQVNSKNGEAYSQSYLRAHLIQGESYAIGNFAGTGKDLIITADSIDTSSNPGQATVSFVYDPLTKPSKIDHYYYNKGWRVEKHERLLADVNGDGKLDIVGLGNSGVLVTLAGPYGGFGTPQAWQYGGMVYDKGWRVENHPRFLADVNGDGRADLVGFGNYGVYVSLSYGSGFTAPEKKLDGFSYNRGWRIESHPRFVTDMNGDGKADIVGFSHHGVWVAYSNGFGFDAEIKIVDNFFNQGSGWRVDKHPRFLEDVNGDGKKDVIGFYNDGVYVSYSNGNRYDPPKKVSDRFGTNTGWRVDSHPRFVTDMDGDGKADIVGFAHNDVWVAYSNGNGFEYGDKVVSKNFVKASGWDVEKHPRFLADVNGDGKKDIVGYGDDGVYASYSSGNMYKAPVKIYDGFGYETGGWRVNMHPRLVADIYGDGRAELVGFGTGATYIEPIF